METQFPACWDWPLPALPIANTKRTLADWQAGRCAMCGKTEKLVEDHGHGTGDTRGYLCVPCNIREGLPDAPDVFALYRERHPATILGLLLRYGRGVHPDIRKDDVALTWAFEAAGGNPHVPRSPLSEALERVGLTWEEWEDRKFRARRSAS